MSFYGNIFTDMGYTIEIDKDENILRFKHDSEAIVVEIPLTNLVPDGSIGTTKLAEHSVTLDKINYKVDDDGFLVIQ